MITPRVINGKGPLLIEKVPLPFSKISNGVYRIFTSDGYIPVKIKLDSYAIPQGYGRFTDGQYCFRRIDCIWIITRDLEIARIVDKAVKSFCEGHPVTFYDLLVSCGSTTPLKVAYAAGILGEHTFPLQKSKTRKYKITPGWIERVKNFNAYYHGLFLFEKHLFKPYCSLPTYWRNRIITLREDSYREIKDKHVLKLVHKYNGMSIEDIAQCSMNNLRVISQLIAIGVFDFI